MGAARSALLNLCYRVIVYLSVLIFMAAAGFISVYFIIFITPMIIIVDFILMCIFKESTKNIVLSKKFTLSICIFLTVTIVLAFPAGFNLKNLKKTVPVLTYHRIDDYAKNSAVPTMSVNEFRMQMKFLKRHGYRSITAEELLRYYDRKAKLPPKAVLITFDDGWRDNYTNALPILKNYGYKATVFLATGKIGTDKFMTWDMIRKMMAYGITFGGHTRDHVNLIKLPKDKQYTEIKESYDDIVNNLKIIPVSFCYPYGGGDLSRVLQNDVKKAGFRIAFASHNYGINTERVNRFAIRRILMPRFHIFHKAELVFLIW